MGNGVYCSTPSKQYVSSAHPTGGHVTRLEHHRRGRHVLLGADVDQQVQTNLTKLLGVLSTVPLLWRLHVASRKPRGRAVTELVRGWAKSFMQRMGFVMRRLRRRLRSCPPPKFGGAIEESYDIFDGGGEQHSS